MTLSILVFNNCIQRVLGMTGSTAGVNTNDCKSTKDSPSTMQAVISACSLQPTAETIMKTSIRDVQILTVEMVLELEYQILSGYYTLFGVRTYLKSDYVLSAASQAPIPLQVVPTYFLTLSSTSIQDRFPIDLISRTFMASFAA